LGWGQQHSSGMTGIGSLMAAVATTVRVSTAESARGE
jgi:hypothetical protein